MADVNQITAEPRERAGKGAARATRRSGRVPGVIYGNKQTPTLISVDPKALSRELHRGASFFASLMDLRLGDDTHRVLPRDVQFDPVTDKPVHIDFLRVTAESRIHVDVPVSFINEGASPGLKRGGVLNIVRHEIEVVCAAGNIPRQIVVDLTDLDIGDGVHISMVPLPAGVTPGITDRDFTIATIAAPTIEKVEVEVAPAAEGEVVETVAGAAGPTAPGAAPAAAAAPPVPEKGAKKS